MSATASLNSLLQDAAARKAGAAEEYAALVALLAAGSDVDASDVVAACEAAGKSLDDLRAAVELRVRREELARTLGDLPARAADERAAEAKHAEVLRRRDAALAEWDAQVRAARQARARAAEGVRDCAAARSELIATADPARRARVEEIDGRLVQAERHVEHLRKRVAAVEAANAADESPPPRGAILPVGFGPEGEAPRRNESPIEARAREAAAKRFAAEVEKARATGVERDSLAEAAGACVVRERARLIAEYRAEAAARLAKARADVAEAERHVETLRAERAAAEADLLRV